MAPPSLSGRIRLMPYNPARSCKYHGCPNLTNHPRGYCPQHLADRYRQEDNNRPASHERGYGRRWRKARLLFLKRNPLCAECLQEGKITEAVVVDHVVPAKGDMGLFWDRDNWQSLCGYHHAVKTAKEDGAFGAPVNR